MIPRRTRRDLLRRLALLGWSAATTRLLAACAAPPPTAQAPSTIALATVLPATPAPSLTPVPVATPTLGLSSRHVPALPAIIRFHPATPSKVVHARHARVWDGESLVPAALRQMLDAAITRLTGLADARAAWAALFRPGERMGIKVGTISTSRYWTHVPLVMAVAECLQDAGIPAEQIVIWDRDSAELMLAGYGLRREGPGVLCYGTDFRFQEGWTVTEPGWAWEPTRRRTPSSWRWR